MDLSKAFDSLNHDLLLAKLAAYGVDLKSLNFLKSYLRNRFQRTKIGTFFSDWLEVILGVPQGSIHGPLLFNIFINDLVALLEKHICNFADDNTVFSCGETFEEVLSHLKGLLSESLEWFSSNMLVVNPQKFQMMFLGCPSKGIQVKIDDNIVLETSDSVKLLGIILDNKLSFNAHIAKLCQTASNNIRCFRRIRNFLSLDQSILLYNSYFLSIFSYAPIAWMFCSKSSMKAINSVHKRSLRVVFNVGTGTLEDLLQIKGLPSIHELHLRHYICEIYKSSKSCTPVIMQDMFQPKLVPYNLRTKNLLLLPTARTSRFGSKLFYISRIFVMELIARYLKKCRISPDT